jgi:hypothetical protein
MKRAVLGCVSTGLVLAGAMLLRAMPGAAGEGTEPLPTVLQAAESNPIDDQNAPPSELRQRYLEVLRKRSELMSEAELRQAIDESQRVLDQHAAVKALQAAVEQCLDELDAVVQAYPNTEAAQRAKAVRDAIATRMSNEPPRKAAVIQFN